eukprot:5946819-Pleurochrysis_carterae.AAC.2
MAPEILGAAEKYNAKVDVWAVGITVIELAEMSPPHAESTSVYATMMRIVQGPPATLKPETDASDNLRDFVKRVLVKDANERPSALELLSHAFVTNTTGEELRELVQSQQHRPRSTISRATHEESENSPRGGTIHL